jgi:hypothetical protein
LQMQVQQMQQAMQAQQQPPQMGQPGQPSQAPMPPQAPQKPPQLPKQVQETLESPTQEDLISLMKDDGLRSYRIDIETDSTIAADEQAEKQSRQEFVTVLGGMLQQALPVAQQVPELVPVIGEALLFLTRAYRTGRQLEDTIENAVAAIEDKAKLAVDTPPTASPNPAMEKVKADAALGAQKLQLQAQETKAKLQLSQQETAAKLHLDAQALNSGVQIDQAKIIADHHTKQTQMALSAQPQQDNQDVNSKLDALMAGMQQMQQIVAALLPQPSMPQNGLPS